MVNLEIVITVRFFDLYILIYIHISVWKILSFVGTESTLGEMCN